MPGVRTSLTGRTRDAKHGDVPPFSDFLCAISNILVASFVVDSFTFMKSLTENKQEATYLIESYLHNVCAQIKKTKQCLWFLVKALKRIKKAFNGDLNLDQFYTDRILSTHHNSQ